MERIETMNVVAPIQALQQRIKELEAENARLRQQLNSANSQIQILNRVIAGDTE